MSVVSQFKTTFRRYQHPVPDYRRNSPHLFSNMHHLVRVNSIFYTHAKGWVTSWACAKTPAYHFRLHLLAPLLTSPHHDNRRHPPSVAGHNTPPVTDLAPAMWQCIAPAKLPLLHQPVHNVWPSAKVPKM